MKRGMLCQRQILINGFRGRGIPLTGVCACGVCVCRSHARESEEPIR